jgi:hypothetical protein
VGTFLSLSCAGGVFALLLWLQEITRRWTDPVALLIPAASIAALFAVNSWEARDELPRPTALTTAAFLAVLAPGLFLGLLDFTRDPGVLRFFSEILSALARTFANLGRYGWALLPVAYAGAALCRRKHRIRPRSDLWFWALVTTVGALVWLRPEPRGLFPQPERPLDDQLFAYAAAAVSGALIGWRFASTGYPPAR